MRELSIVKTHESGWANESVPQLCQIENRLPMCTLNGNFTPILKISSL